MYKVLIQDEGGWALWEQVEADRCIHCKTGGLSALEEAFPRYPLRFRPSDSILPHSSMPQPRQQLLGNCPSTPKDYFGKGLMVGQLLSNPHPSLHLPLHSHGNLSTRHGTELVRKPGRAAVTNTQVPRR